LTEAVAQVVIYFASRKPKVQITVPQKTKQNKKKLEITGFYKINFSIVKSLSFIKHIL
jgi:hypothetical protein